MRFEFVNAQRSCELSRKTFVRMLIGSNAGRFGKNRKVVQILPR